MVDYIFKDENGNTEFDFSKAEEVIELHEKYKSIPLSDVDFIIENADKILFIEYKNSKVPNAANPAAFEEKLKDDEHYKKMARKYYDSIIYVMACEKTKPFEYIYILEADKADIVVRKMIAAKIKRKLPFELQQENAELKRELISDFYVVNIAEWNERFPDYQIKPVAKGA